MKKLVMVLFCFLLLFGSIFSDVYGNTGETKAKAEREKACEGSGNCIDQASFMIGTDALTGTNKLKVKGDTTATINNVLGTIIQKLMIALGSISLLVMTIGGGYMVLYHGQDELLSKGKTIFNSGIIALVIALGSYYLIAFVRFILYS